MLLWRLSFIMIYLKINSRQLAQARMGSLCTLGSGFIMNKNNVAWPTLFIFLCWIKYFLYDIFTLLCKNNKILHVYYCGCPTSITFAFAHSHNLIEIERFNNFLLNLSTEV